MHSIRTQLTALMIAAMLVSLLSIGGMSVYSVQTEGDRHAVQTMSLVCENSRRMINGYLNSVEQSVDMVTRYVNETLNSADLIEGGVVGAAGDGWRLSRDDWDSPQQQALDAHLRDHLEEARIVFRSAANHTNGIISYYYRINPEISRDEPGFLFSKIGTAQFAEITPTEIPLYDPDDIDHVGWYYLPLRRGRPSWIAPYHNDNLGIRMVSYVTPIYKAGTFVGVVGMDIDYETLVRQIQGMRILNSGYVILTEPDGTIAYHPELPVGANLAEGRPEIVEALEVLRTREDSGANPVRYNYKGVAKQMFFNTLSNGMRLIVVAPEAEILATTTALMRGIIVTGIMILLGFGALMGGVAQRITQPLSRLTAASKRLAEGDYNVELAYDKQDEVGILTEAFRQLVEHLRIYINDLNSRAYQDALTGVKNKGAYGASARMLNDAIRLSLPMRRPEFALVMLDCNDLKKINDVYGHDKGDLYLQRACELICRVFAHSPVFRMGGDEFAVILQKDDYQARKDLMTMFDAYAGEINAEATEPWEEVRIAKGMAKFDPRKDISVESVLQRADERMYADKQRYKAMRGASFQTSAEHLENVPQVGVSSFLT